MLTRTGRTVSLDFGTSPLHPSLPAVHTQWITRFVCEGVHTQSPEDNLQELALSFPRVGPGDQIQAVRFGDKHLWLLRHLFQLFEKSQENMTQSKEGCLEKFSPALKQPFLSTCRRYSAINMDTSCWDFILTHSIAIDILGANSSSTSLFPSDEFLNVDFLATGVHAF